MNFMYWWCKKKKGFNFPIIYINNRIWAIFNHILINCRSARLDVKSEKFHFQILTQYSVSENDGIQLSFPQNKLRGLHFCKL